MRIMILTGGVLLGVAIQATLLVMLNLPFQLAPDLIMVIVIAYGLLRGPDEGLVFGVVAGFFVDLISGGLVGIGALSKMAAGFLAGLLEKTVFKDNLLLPAMASFLGTLVFSSFEILMEMAFKANYHFGLSLISEILPLALINALIAPLVYYLLFKLEHFIVEQNDNL